MVGIVIIKMKLAILSHSFTGNRAIWLAIRALLGLMLAGATIWLAASSMNEQNQAAGLVSLAFFCWMIGWLLDGLLRSGDESLQTHHFTLLPLSSWQVTLGLFGTVCIGVGPVVTLIAYTLPLIIIATKISLLAIIIALPVALLQWIGTLLLASIITEVLHAQAKSRLATEIAAILLGLLLALAFTWWTLFPLFESISRMISSGPAPLLTRLFILLPSGWGLVAVNAAGAHTWPSALGILIGMTVWCGLLFFVWSRLLRRQTRALLGTRPSKSKAGSTREGYQLLATPLFAVISKELIMWRRDPWRARFLRMAFWVGLFSGTIPLIGGWTSFLPWMGAFMIIIIAIPAGNIYAFDGSALWLNLGIPGSERIDIRGRQLAWLLLVAPVTLLLTLTLTWWSQQDWAWPWVLAIVPALLGGTAGLLALVSVFLLVPLTEPWKRNQSPIVTGPDNGQITLQMRLMLLLVIGLGLPPAVIVLAGTLLHLPNMQWFGVLVGIGEGILFPWWSGRLAIQRLEERGSELLNVMRHGKAVQMKRATHTQHEELPKGKSAVIALLIISGILATIPQGIVALIFNLAGIQKRVWFAALYLPPPFQLPASLIFLLLGISALVGAGLLLKSSRKKR
ncbi:hypothetical protein KDA_52100 [Dictyobacter alpinus]|uniref:Uncharacterized protein n=1 Tax=Dictyobacter alpinus TaxID=2014873 RepID=A0A402BEJ4_9CHLR|nr:hypothetical protein [Dictyobacter alpinus]GCE29726.1 hypothetical protein KDA_52100 [Dictyobacter alpinus]